MTHNTAPNLFERYLVQWKGHLGQTWESLNTLRNTKKLGDWSKLVKTQKTGSSKMKAYVMDCGAFDARQCCTACGIHNTLEPHMYMDAAEKSNVSKKSYSGKTV